MNTDVEKTADRQGIIAWAAQAYGVEAGKVLGVLKATCFSQGKDVDPPSDAEVAALLIVAREYGLNPFVRQIYAFKNRNGGIVPVVGVDGYAHAVNSHPQCDGFAFSESDKKIDHKGKQVPEWIECTIFRKDRTHHSPVREYFSEVVRGTGAWDQTPARMLRHRAYMQSARITLGITVQDEEDARTTMEIDVTPIGGPAKVAGPQRAAAPAKAADPVAGGDPKKPEPAVIDGDTGEILNKTPPTLADVDKLVDAAATMEDLNAVLSKITSLPATPERQKLMVKWNDKVKAALPKKPIDEQPTGTPAQCEALIKKMDKAANKDKLDDFAVEAQGFKWAPELLAKINAAYTTKSTALEAA